MTTRFRAGCAALALLLGGTVVAARATQDNLIPPTTGVYTGVQFSNLLGDAFRSLASCNSGTSAPANVDAAAIKGQCWLDTSVTPNLIKTYTGTDWVTVGALDESNTLWSPPLGGGKAQIASGSTVDLGSVPQSYIEITGTATITSFGSSAPNYSSKIVKFLGAATLTYSSALPVPGGFSLTVDAGARALVTHLGSGNWEFIQFTRASGIVVDASRLGRAEYTFASAPPANAVFGYGQALTRTSYPAYLAAVAPVQSGTRTSSSRIITALTSTAGFGAGMPVEGTGIPSGATISSVDSTTQITLDGSHAATTSGAANVTVFLTGYGSGGSASTVGVPDCQGRLLAGRDNTSGTTQGRITNAGSGVVGTALNAAGGAQSLTLAQANLPNVSLDTQLNNGTVSITDTRNWTVRSYNGGTVGGASALLQASTSNNDFSVTVTGSIAGSVSDLTGFTSTLSGGVAQTAFNKLPPALISNCVIYVQP